MGNRGGCPGSDTFCPASLTFGGVFIEPATGFTAAPYSRLSIRQSRNATTVRWYATRHVLGFNVYDGRIKLNHHLITSRSHWYTFTSPHPVIHRLHITAVPPSGSDG
jgi:hypothetical protein